MSCAADTFTRYMCEIDLACSNGWYLYTDTDGSEGKNSCVDLVLNAGVAWSGALTSCKYSTHLLTMNTMGAGTAGLPGYILSLNSLSSMWVGCSQSASASQRARGWTWVDGTPDGNLNCGDGSGYPNVPTATIWASGEPK